MKSAVARGVVAVSTVVVLGLTAACSGGSSGDGGGAGKDEKPGSADSAPTSAPASASASAKLEKAALASRDVKKYKVESGPGEAEDKGTDKAGPSAGRVNPAECRPLAEMLTAAAPAKSKAHVSRTLTSTDVADTTTTEVVLLAYGQADAEKTMDTLRAATRTKKCATFGDGGRRYIGVRPQPGPVDGDEAVSYKLASRTGEFLHRDRVTVVRSGSTLIAFRASNIFDPRSPRSGEEGDPKVADGIVEAQLTKLAAAK
ncbi:hypothetical protein AB0I66_17595 [Streptomyces sp. NPDC050439]|uniref:hypothetical protein n=1 Tax=unclassified Streptomyces TaxID=2593676 RepID=UPI003418AF1E